MILQDNETWEDAAKRLHRANGILQDALGCDEVEDEEGTSEASSPTTSQKFYRTVIQIEILSEEPYKTENILNISHDITEGHYSGSLTDIVRNEEKSGKEMADLLLAQHSDPGFFCLNEDGSALEEE